MNKILKYFTAAAILPLLFSSCDLTKDPDSEGTATEAIAGDYYVQILLDGDEFDPTYYPLHIYNTSANVATECWIDASSVWPFKVKAPCDVSSKSFGFLALTDNPLFLDIVGVPDSVSILEGQIFDDAATTTGGNISDSISISFISTGVEVFGLPRGTYTMVGYKRTGFLEDEH